MALGNLHVELQLIADQYFAGMKNAQREATTLSNSFRPLTKTLADFGNGMKSVGIGLTASITAPLVAIGTVAVKTGIDFESAFADVRKSVQATEPEFASLRNELRQMAKEIPISAVELASVADAAGQLGIKTENIAEFTRTMAKMGATTNLSATDAANAMARFDNITGGTQKTFDRMGSSLVALGADLAATESEIINMAQNMGAAGHQIGLSQAEILGLAAALSSVGLEAERGGTAFYRVMIKMQDAVKSGGKDLKMFSAVAGVDFKKAFEADAAGAINAFIAGLAKAHLSGKNLTPILESLELKEIRVSDALRRTGNAYQLVARAVDLSRDAYAKNNALQHEFSERLKTTEAKLIVLKNALQDVGITLFDSLRPIIHETILPLLTKLVGAIADAANKFAKLPQPVQTATIALLALGASIGPAMVALGFAVTQISALIPVAVRLASILSGGAGVTAAMKSVATASTITAGEMALFGRSAAYVGTQTTTAAAGLKGVGAAATTAGANTAAAAGGAATLAGSLSKVGIASVAAKAGVFGLIAAGAAVSTAFLKAHFDLVGYEASLVRAHDSGVRLNHALRNIDFATWGSEIKSALSSATEGLEKFTPEWLKLILNMPKQINEARKALGDFMPDWREFLGIQKETTWGDFVHYGMGFARMDQISAGLEMLGKNPGVPGGLKVAGVGQAGSRVQGPIDPFASMDPEARKAFAAWPQAKKDLLKQIAAMESGGGDQARAIAEAMVKAEANSAAKELENLRAKFQSALKPADDLQAEISKLGFKFKTASEFDEKAFQQWYAKWAERADIDPNPDSPLHKYDYRAAFSAGVVPEISKDDGLYHWPSEFKADDHPNRFVNGVDTKITGRPAGTVTPLGGMSKDEAEIIAVYGERIIQATKAQEDHGFAVSDTMNRLTALALMVEKQQLQKIRLSELAKKSAEVEAEQIQAVAEATKNWAQQSENLDFSFLPKPDITMPDFEPLEPGDLLQAEAVTRVGELNDQLKALKTTVPAVERQVRLLRIEGKTDAEIMALLGGEMESAARIAKQFNVPLGELTRTIMMQQGRTETLRNAWGETFGSISDNLVDLLIDWDLKWKRMGDIGKGVLKNLGRSLLDGLVKPFKEGLTQLGEGLAKTLAGALFGGGKGQQGGGLFSGLGSALGGIFGSGGGIFGGGGPSAADYTRLPMPGMAGTPPFVGGGSGAAGTAAGFGLSSAMGLVSGLAGPVTEGIKAIFGRKAHDAADDIVHSQNAFTNQTLAGILADDALSATNKLKLVNNAWDQLLQTWENFAGSDVNNQIVQSKAFATVSPLVTQIQSDLIKQGASDGSTASGGGNTIEVGTIQNNFYLNGVTDVPTLIEWIKFNFGGLTEEIVRQVELKEQAVVSR